MHLLPDNAEDDDTVPLNLERYSLSLLYRISSSGNQDIYTGRSCRYCASFPKNFPDLLSDTRLWQHYAGLRDIARSYCVYIFILRAGVHVTSAERMPPDFFIGIFSSGNRKRTQWHRLRLRWIINLRYPFLDREFNGIPVRRAFVRKER